MDVSTFCEPISRNIGQTPTNNFDLSNKNLMTSERKVMDSYLDSFVDLSDIHDGPNIVDLIDSDY